MDRLPSEILLAILKFTVVSLYGNKNQLLRLRTTCKLFDNILKPFALRTLQLEYTRLDKSQSSIRPPDENALRRIGPLCRALYLDMMVVRDDDEVSCLTQLLEPLPTMSEFLSRLRDRYHMNEESFTELEYREKLEKMLEHVSQVSAVRLNLPFHIVTLYPAYCRTATMILGNTFKALAGRPEESQVLETLVIENLIDTAARSLWYNPLDVRNIIDVFHHLKHLVLSVRRQEINLDNAIDFHKRLWEMIETAGELESLCLIGLDMNENHPNNIKTSTYRDLSPNDWQFRSILSIHKPKSTLPHLTYLELRDVEVMGSGLVGVLRCFCRSLRELYLDGVYLKTIHDPQGILETTNTLWIGLPNVRPEPDHEWVAVRLREMGAQLRVCRATNLGYDQYMNGDDLLHAPTHDLIDPCGLSRPLEQRFVEVATGIKQPDAPDGTPVAYWPKDPSQTWAYADRARPSTPRMQDWDAASYLATECNPTSSWKRAIDGQFPNCNPFTLATLRDIADNTYTGFRHKNIPRTWEDAEDVEGFLRSLPSMGGA
ncbi:hypothetical protein F4779DRAFT_526563 [Xylariaceae sp. FL0662B]|nr:hypothetical protein F4779DRAFT_526563 [Xylariaceae sp. FL0662B]